jgi:hypothetical protein
MKRNQVITVLIASVWISFGLLCKVLGLVPRHEQIVASILGDAHAGITTRAIGVGEVLVGLWVLAGFRRRATALGQIVLVATMNVLETMLAPDLLLWGHFNLLFAAAFIYLIYWNEWGGGNPNA